MKIGSTAKSSFICILIVTLFLRAWQPDSFELMQKLMFGIEFGNYYIHPCDLALVVLVLIYFLSQRKISLFPLVIFGSFALSFAIDYLFFPLENSFITSGDIFVAYLKILSPLFGAYVLVQILDKKKLKMLVNFSGLTFLFIGLQHLFFSVFPRMTWTTESFSFWGFNVYRSISTSGPATSSSYVMVILYAIVCCYYRVVTERSLFLKTTNSNLLTFPLVFSTFSRGGIFILVSSWIYNQFFINGKKVMTKWIVAYVCFFFLIIISIGLWNVRQTQGYNIDADISRIRQIQNVITVIKDGHVILFGKGFGSSYFREVHSSFFWDNSKAFPIGATHNLNMLLLMELGLIRLLFIYLGLFWIFKKGRNNISLAKAFFVLFVVVAFNTETSFLFSQYNFAFFLFLFLFKRNVFRNQRLNYKV